MGIAAIVTLGVLAGCSSSSTSSTSGSTTASPGSTEAASTPSTDPATRDVVTPFFLRGGKVAAGEAMPAPGPDRLQAALDVLLGGLSDADRAADLTDAISSYVELRGARMDGTTAIVDFNRAFETANTRPQVGQVVFTLTQLPGVDKVRFLIEGDTNGATGVPPLSRDDLGDLTPTILLESPAPGAPPLRSFRANGSAAPSLTEVPWRVEAAGVPLASGTTPANVARGAQRKRFSAAVDLPTAPAGPADLVVGPGPDEIRLPITIGP